jgi:glycosyltransferase involved in cell wall biosynthesis
MKITWVTRSFLDYRIPVYAEINRLCRNQLTVIYFADVVPIRCQDKLKAILGERAIGLTGEIRLTGKKNQPISKLKRKGIRLPYQPGLITKVKESKPDVILSDGFFQWTYAALWLRILKKIPHVMCYEGTTHTERNAGVLRTSYRKFSGKWIDFIMCNGLLTAEYVKSLGYPTHKIGYGNMAADTTQLSNNVAIFSDTDKNNLKNKLQLNAYVFVFIGRLVELKGVDKLISAWITKFKDNTNVSLLIIGDGDQYEHLRPKTINEKCINIQFTGAIDYDNIYQYLAISNIFVIPTLQDNWSLVVPEAMSCGLPVIGSNIPGIAQMITEGENGLLVETNNTKLLAEKIITLLENKKLRQHLGSNARLLAVEKYSASTMLNAYLSALNS